MDARFAKAARHSRLVRFLRIAVPGVVALSMAAIIGVSVFNPFRILTTLPVDVGDMVVSGTKITMESPHLSGFSPDQRPYEIWAKTATQDLTTPNKVDLTQVRGKVLTEDRQTVTIESDTGLFDTKAQLLDLRKNVFLQTSGGYEVRLNQALVDIANGGVSTDDGVDVKLTNGTVRADRLRLTDKGEVVRFEGNVVMRIVAEQPVEAAPPEPAPKQRSQSGNRAGLK
jgi:lipopolysaccharide export system protein LptC